MTTTQIATKPIDRILELLPDAKGPRNDWYSCRCPAHPDKNPSFSFKAMGDENSEDGEGVELKCFSGCSRQAILDALNLTEQELHYRSSSLTITPRQKRTKTLTLMDLATTKLLVPTYLISLGIDDGESVYHRKEDGRAYTQKGVVIPYFTEDGQKYARYRLRTALKAKDGTIWNENDKENPLPPIPYGLHKLDMARASHKLIIVEGESDCWTLWQFGFSALGIPGASNFATIKLAYLQDIDTIYILQEPDPAGQTFPVKVKKHLDSIGYKGKIYAVDLTEFDSAKDPNDLHLKLVAKHNNIKSFHPTIEKALQRAIPLFVPGKEPEKPTIFTLQDLMKKKLAPVKWVIPGILPEGLTMLTGKPKLGKSWLGFDIALAIAWGGYVMGKIKVERGEVLYLALEDNERRIQKRMGILLSNASGQVPAGLHMSLTWPRIDKGGAEQLEDWIKAHPDARIIIVDTWTKLSPRIMSKQQSLYETQYDALVPLKAIADKYAIAIVAIHHNRKMGADDVVDEISGSTGLTGSVDGFLVLRRERGQTDAVLHVIGRDIEEEQALAINFDASEARWKLEGNAEEFAKTKERQDILNLLKKHLQGLTAKEVATELNKNLYTVRNLLSSLRDEGKIKLTTPSYIYTLVRSEGSEGSESSYRSEHSEADNSSSQNGSQPHYDTSQPHYGEGTSVVRPNTATHKPVEPIQNDRKANLTTVTTVTTCDLSITSNLTGEKAEARKAMIQCEYEVHEAARKPLHPDEIENYPDDVYDWYKSRSLKMPLHRCTRGHKPTTYLPWYSPPLEGWEGNCTRCYPGLAQTNGRECEVQS